MRLIIMSFGGPSPLADRRAPQLVLGGTLALALTLGGVTGCGDSSPAPEGDGPGRATLTVAVSIPPQAYFVERLGGPHVRVRVMVGPGANPATYEPKASQLRDLVQADAYLSIGVPFETGWLERFSAANPRMRMVDTTRGIDRVAEGGTADPHIWLSPQLVAIQAETIHDTLTGLDPGHRTRYDANLRAFRTDITALDNRIRQTLDEVSNRAFIVFHPSWRYFARAYGLEMIPIELGGTEPGPAQLARVVDEARRRDIHVVFAQPEFTSSSARTIASAIDGDVLLISPLERDWLANLDRVAVTLARALAR